MMDETSENIKYIAPDHHFLESWGDANPKEGFYSLSQPTISPDFQQPCYTTEKQLVSIMGRNAKETSHYDYLKKYWKENMHAKQNQFNDFEDFWEHIVEHGFFTGKGNPGSLTSANTFFGSCISWQGICPTAPSKNLEVVLLRKSGLIRGWMQNSNNPWLIRNYPTLFLK